MPMPYMATGADGLEPHRLVQGSAGFVGQGDASKRLEEAEFYESAPQFCPTP